MERLTKNGWRETSTYEKGFNGTLFECITISLDSRLGEAVVSTLYYAIEERFKLRRAEFPKQPLEVLKDLKSILGETGYNVIEPVVLNNIKETFKVVEQGIFDLERLVEIARKNYLQGSR